MTALSDLMCTPRSSAAKAAIERTSRRFIHHASIAAAEEKRKKEPKMKSKNQNSKNQKTIKN